MSLHLPRRRTIPVEPVTTYEIAGTPGTTPTPLTGTIVHPEEFSPLALRTATDSPDPAGTRAWVSGTIGRLLSASALDDLTFDVLDAHIAAQAKSWDVSTDRQAPGRLHVALRLAAAHLQGIAETQLKVAELRTQHAAAVASVDRWTHHLTGEPTATYEPDPTPMTVHLSSVLAAEPVISQASAYVHGLHCSSPTLAQEH